MRHFGIYLIFWGIQSLFIGLVFGIIVAKNNERLFLMSFGVFFLLTGILLVATEPA